MKIENILIFLRNNEINESNAKKISQHLAKHLPHGLKEKFSSETWQFNYGEIEQIALNQMPDIAECTLEDLQQLALFGQSLQKNARDYLRIKNFFLMILFKNFNRSIKKAVYQKACFYLNIRGFKHSYQLPHCLTLALWSDLFNCDDRHQRRMSALGNIFYADVRVKTAIKKLESILKDDMIFFQIKSAGGAFIKSCHILAQEIINPAALHDLADHIENHIEYLQDCLAQNPLQSGRFLQLIAHSEKFKRKHHHSQEFFGASMSFIGLALCFAATVTACIIFTPLVPLASMPMLAVIGLFCAVVLTGIMGTLMMNTGFRISDNASLKEVSRLFLLEANTANIKSDHSYEPFERPFTPLSLRAKKIA